MRKRICGGVMVDRELAEDDFWLAEPFSRAQAFIDLILIANTESHDVTVRGVTVRLEKGQVGRSVISLADRWRWSRNKTRAFLDDLRDLRKIDFKMTNIATVITVLDYTVLNPKRITESTPEGTPKGIAEGDADYTPEGTTESTAEGDAESTQSRGAGERRDNKSRGAGGEPPPKNAVSMERAIELFAGLDSGYSEAEIKSAWCELSAGAIDGNWVTGRPPRPVADWRSALMSELWKRRSLYGGNKNGAPPEPKAPTAAWLTLDQMRAPTP